jgi:hypothetical protein
VKFNHAILVCIILFSFGCKKEQPVFENNTIPPYDEVPTIKIQNYTNRLFIDILGREPLDSEMDLEVAVLEAGDLSMSVRESLIEKLQFSLAFVEGDSSYNHAYFNKIYEDTKARLIEGVSDTYIQQEYGIFDFAAFSDSLDGNIAGYEYNRGEANKLKAIIESKEEYRLNEINIDDMYRRMMFNSIYDEINMNTFNFVNASFDDLYFRFPTDTEFENAFVIIENNQAANLFGQIAQNKSEYLDILTTNNEYEEGMIHWAFLSLLSREPSTNESFALLNNFHNSYNLQEVQKVIMMTDEYAGFD